MKYTLLALISLLVIGCATPISQSNLYWGRYSHTLYNTKKEPGEESNQAHEKELLSIVEKSQEKNLRVPPGIYAELGIFALERGDKNAAANYFRLEQSIYPEGEALMQKALNTQPK